jgi:PAS domain S-box-containing protein
MTRFSAVFGVLSGSVLLAWLAWRGAHAGYGSAAFGVSLAASAAVVILGGLAYWNAARLGRAYDERRNAEFALAHESYLLRSLMDNIPDAIYFKDVQSRFTLTNNNCHYQGINSPEEAVGKTDFDFFTDEHALDAFLDEQRIIHTGEPVIGKVEKETFLDGSVGWVLTTKAPIRDEAGRISGIVGVSRDITEMVNAETALRESEARFQLVMRATNEAVYDWNIETGGLWWNQNLQKGFGYVADEIELTLDWWERRIHPEDREAVMQSLDNLLESASQKWEGEYRFLRSDGTYAHVFDRGFVVRDESDKPARMIGSVMDITERKLAESALREVKLLQGILPLCSYCKKIRDDSNYWQQVEHYIADHSEAEFSHGICPDCFEGVVRPQLNAGKSRAPVLS